MVYYTFSVLAYCKYSLIDPSSGLVDFSEASGTKHLNKFMRGIYGGDVFLPCSTAITLVDSLDHFLKAYAYLACKAFDMGVPAFPMFPKLHAVHEISFEMRRQCQAAPYVFNVAAMACPVDEDFVGRCAAISRKVSPRLIAKRFLERYCAHIQILWARG